MSDRAARARQLRNRRNKSQMLPAMETEDGTALEMSATSTIACILLLLGIGASIATTYFMMHNPGCMGGGKSASSALSPDLTGSSVRGAPAVTTVQTTPATTATATASVPAVPATAPAPVAPPPATRTGTVPACSADEMTVLKRQLPAEGCYAAAYTQACSFTKATAKNPCPYAGAYFRDVIASTTFGEGFTAVILGLKDQDDAPMDLLMLGSHDAEKYPVDKWRQVVGLYNCPRPPVTLSDVKNKAKVLILEPDISKALLAKRWKSTTGMTDEDMKGETTQIASNAVGGAVMTLTQWAEKNVPNGHIHYLRIVQGGLDFDILASGAGGGGALERVWYVEFQYDWKGNWERYSLKPLITEKLTQFACYWQGGDNNLWRITSCWQEHYAQRSWSQVVCVNVVIPEAKPLYDKMEYYFQETLKKDLKFA